MVTMMPMGSNDVEVGKVNSTRTCHLNHINIRGFDGKDQALKCGLRIRVSSWRGCLGD
jgi:hypothetical protein